MSVIPTPCLLRPKATKERQQDVDAFSDSCASLRRIILNAHSRARVSFPSASRRRLMAIPQLNGAETLTLRLLRDRAAGGNQQLLI